METAKVADMLLDMQKRLLNFAYSLTLNKDDAEDLLQSTSLKVLDNSDKFTNANFTGWIFTIMRNIFINDYNKSARRNTSRENDEIRSFLHYVPNEEAESPEEIYNVKEINQAISNLNDDCRIPFGLYVAGYKYQEIADEMNLPLGTVKSRIFNSRQQLQERLKEFGY